MSERYRQVWKANKNEKKKDKGRDGQIDEKNRLINI